LLLLRSKEREVGEAMQHKISSWNQVYKEVCASMYSVSAAWNRRWPVLGGNAAEPDVEEEEEQEAGSEEQEAGSEEQEAGSEEQEEDEEAPEEVPEDVPEEVEDGTIRDGEPGGYRYNAFL